MNPFFIIFLFKSLINLGESEHDYYLKMDKIVDKFREKTNLNIEYKFQDFRFEANRVNLIIQIKDFYVEPSSPNDPIKFYIYHSGGKTFKEVVDKFIDEINKLDITKIKNNIKKYNKSFFPVIGYSIKYLEN